MSNWYEHEREGNYPPRVAKPYCRVLPQRTPGDMWIGYLRKRGLEPAIAGANGWYQSAAIDGSYRLVIPCTSSDPDNRYWQARSMTGVEPRYESPHGVSRGDALCLVWPYSYAGPPLTVIITEGPMDALAAAGETALGVALMGNTPPGACDGFLAEIARGRRVIAIEDLDAPGTISAVLVQAGVSHVLRSSYPARDLAEASPELRRKLCRLG